MYDRVKNKKISHTCRILVKHLALLTGQVSGNKALEYSCGGYLSSYYNTWEKNYSWNETGGDRVDLNASLKILKYKSIY